MFGLVLIPKDVLDKEMQEKEELQKKLNSANHRVSRERGYNKRLKQAVKELKKKEYNRPKEPVRKPMYDFLRSFNEVYQNDLEDMSFWYVMDKFLKSKHWTEYHDVIEDISKGWDEIIVDAVKNGYFLEEEVK